MLTLWKNRNLFNWKINSSFLKLTFGVTLQFKLIGLYMIRVNRKEIRLFDCNQLDLIFIIKNASIGRLRLNTTLFVPEYKNETNTRYLCPLTKSIGLRCMEEWLTRVIFARTAEEDGGVEDASPGGLRGGAGVSGGRPLSPGAPFTCNRTEQWEPEDLGDDWYLGRYTMLGRRRHCDAAGGSGLQSRSIGQKHPQ